MVERSHCYIFHYFLSFSFSIVNQLKNTTWDLQWRDDSLSSSRKSKYAFFPSLLHIINEENSLFVHSPWKKKGAPTIISGRYQFCSKENIDADRVWLLAQTNCLGQANEYWWFCWWWPGNFTLMMSHHVEGQSGSKQHPLCR